MPAKVWSAVPGGEGEVDTGRGQQGGCPAGGQLPVGWAPANSRLFLSVLQIEDETQVSRATQGEQDNYEMHVRAANIVSH